MKKTILLSTIALLLAGVCGITSCEKNSSPGCQYGTDGAASDELPAYLQNCPGTYFEVPPTNPANGKQFNYDKFVNALMDSLPNVGGMQYAVMQGSFLYASGGRGDAREAGACPPLKMSACVKMNIASVTKMFTVAVTLKFLYDQGLDETATIGQFLPPSWNCPADVAALTFQQMFSHRSGMQQFSANNNFNQTLSYSGLKTFVQSGTNEDSIGVQQYRNANVALMRIIIPRLWQNRIDCPQELKDAPEVTDELSQKFYERAVKQFIFQPVGADGYLQRAEMGDFEPLNYNVNGSGGTTAGDWKAITGGGGWYMNAEDMVKVMSGLSNGTIVSNAIITAMRNKVMGTWNYINVNDGQLMGHGGDISESNGEWHSLLVYNATTDMSIAVNINTGVLPNGGGLSRAVQNAYNLAWE